MRKALILLVSAIIVYTGVIIATNKTDALKQEINGLELRLQEQKTQQTEELALATQSMQAQLEGAQQQADVLRKENEDLKAKTASLEAENLSLKKDNPVTIESASVGGVKRAIQGQNKALTGFEVTWYNDTGQTRSGAYTKDGVTVSVDPRVIPIGTQIKIVMPDGTELIRKAEDTGSAVKGRILDVYASASTSELRRRGRTKNVTVYLE